MARGHRRIAAIAVVALTAVAGSASAASASSWSITKQTDPDGDPASFTFSYTGYKEPFNKDSANQEKNGEEGTFTLKDGETFSSGEITNGVYVIQEQTPAGWKVLDIVCDSGGDTTDVPDITIDAGRVDLQVSPGESKSCTFTNQKLPQPIAPPPVVEATPEVVQNVVQPPAPTPPVVQVAPRRVRSAAARLVGPKRCVSNRYSVAVTGGPVRSVSFWVNGKRVKTVRARTGQRRFTANIPLRSAVARVQARVSFASDARPRSRTLRTTIRRCAPRVVRPQFTG